jgi:hypothetical protein
MIVFLVLLNFVLDFTIVGWGKNNTLTAQMCITYIIQYLKTRSDSPMVPSNANDFNSTTWEPLIL